MPEKQKSSEMSEITSAKPDTPAETHEEKREPENMSRRKFLATGAALAWGLANGARELGAERPVPPNTESQQENQEHRRLSRYRSGILRGRSVNPEFRRLIGSLPDDPRYKDPRIYVIPEWIEANFSQQLTDMWDYKVEIDADEAVIRFARTKLTAEYREQRPERKDINAYLADIQNTFKRLRYLRVLNWDNLAELRTMRMPAERVQLVKEIAESIKPGHFLAYILTELMPSLTDGELNSIIRFVIPTDPDVVGRVEESSPVGRSLDYAKLSLASLGMT